MEILEAISRFIATSFVEFIIFIPGYGILYLGVKSWEWRRSNITMRAFY
jgi:hypothetical protein